MASDLAIRKCSGVNACGAGSPIERIPKIRSEATSGIPIQLHTSEKILHFCQHASSLVSATSTDLRSIRTLLSKGYSVGLRTVNAPLGERRGASRATRSCESVSANRTQAEVEGTTSARQAGR